MLFSFLSRVDPTGEELRERVKKLKDNAYASKTKSSRGYQEKRYFRFCDLYDVDAFAPSVRDIVMYIAYLSFWMIYSSVTNYLSAVCNLLKSHGGFGIDYSDYSIKSALRGLRRVSAKGRGKARALFPRDLLQLFNVLDVSLYDDLLFWSAVTLAYRCLFRSSNVCGPHALKRCNVKFTVEGMTVRVVSSKTDQFGDKPREIVVTENSASVLCPVAWLKRLCLIAKPHTSDCVFRVKVVGGTSPMSYSWLRRKLSDVVSKAGLSGTGISTHSFRRGSASFMSGIGYELSDVKRRGGWASNTVLEYIDELPGNDWLKDSRFANHLV